MNQQLQVLQHSQIEKKIARMALQLIEFNFDQSHLWLAGISGQGIVLANLLKDKITQCSNKSVEAFRVDINKYKPDESEVIVDLELDKINGGAVILVDDVLNSGNTAIHALKPFLSVQLDRIQTAFLVDRGYKKYPVSSDIVGYELSTTLQDHVKVDLSNHENMSVYLV